MSRRGGNGGATKSVRKLVTLSGSWPAVGGRAVRDTGRAWWRGGASGAVSQMAGTAGRRAEGARGRRAEDRPAGVAAGRGAAEGPAGPAADADQRAQRHRDRGRRGVLPVPAVEGGLEGDRLVQV